MIELSNVTLIAVATRDIESTVKALEYSCRGITYGTVKLVASHKPANLPSYIQYEYIDPFPTIDDWNYYMVYWLYLHVQTEFALLIHNDGFVVNPEFWKPEFLQYDYIGSGWSHECAIAIQGGRDQPLSRVGNSVGIRSKKLMELPQSIFMPWRRFNADSNEDTYISCHNRKLFEEYGCKFAPLELAIEFGREEEFPENQHITHPFIFHKWFNRNHIYPRL